MTLNEWEQRNIEILTSREMGEWLSRRENRLLEQIRDEIKDIRDNGNLTKIPYFYVSRCLQIIDKYKENKE